MHRKMLLETTTSKIQIFPTLSDAGQEIEEIIEIYNI